ncbi:hypothetical protein PR048_008214 [Dryococelus australis]|uniref:Uncharacterized protein n=1 Tax=Dryococelus australis TaxID=614101 RepID=A0ABQ9HWG4_9NEOP|nr:hypothetical protein PR048_008214 [Dryococelus australis]
MCQNLKTSKATLTAASIAECFDHLKASLTENGTADGVIQPERIFNNNETNLCNDPGVKKSIFKHGTKYPERVKYSSKSSTSVMLCGSASGHLSPYIVPGTTVVAVAGLMHQFSQTGF